MKKLLPVLLLVYCLPAFAQNAVVVHVVDAQNAPVVGAKIDMPSGAAGVPIAETPGSDAKGDLTLDLAIMPTEDAPQFGTIAAKGFAFKRVRLVGAKTEIQLEKSVNWQGMVTDENGAPVAGAQVKVNGRRGPGGSEDTVFLGNTAFASAYTVKTDATGHFEIADVPIRGFFARIEAPKFAGLLVQGEDATTPKTFKLIAGAIVTGRLLGVDGQPLVKIHVWVQPGGGAMGYGQTDTGADGSFTLDTLEPGTYNLMATAPLGAPYLIPAIESIRVAKGEVLAPIELRAMSAVEVTGIVRDSATGLPIAGASLGKMGPDRPRTSAAVDISSTSGADGKFKVRCLPGTNTLYFYQVPKGYRRPQTQRSISVGAEMPTSLDFSLEPTKDLHGLILDEAGNPIAATVNLDYNETFTSKADGKWKFDTTNLEVPEDTVAPGGGDAPDGYWEVVSPSTIELNDTSEITIKVRKKPWQVLPGRAVGLDGKPLSGVNVTGIFYSRGNATDDRSTLYPSQRSVVTNANGDFTIPQIRVGADAQMLSIKGTKTGFVQRGGGEISKNGPVLQLSDLVFAALNRNVEGTTAPGATVVIDGKEATADAAGKFAFTGLAEGDTPAFAAKDDLFGGGPVQTPEKIELKKLELQGVDPELAKEIWQDTVRAAAGLNYYSLPLVQVRLLDGLPRLEQVNKLAGQGDFAIMYLLRSWNYSGDAASLQAACAAIKNSDLRLRSLLTCARHTGDAALSQGAINEAKAKFATPTTQTFSREMSLYSVVSVIYRTQGEAAGFQALDEAIAFTEKNHGLTSQRANRNAGAMSRDDIYAMQSRVVAAGGLPLLRRLISKITSDPTLGYQAQALTYAIPVIAKKFGYEAALPLFDELEKVPETQQNENSDGGNISKGTAFALAAAGVLPLMEKDPAAAQQLVSRVHDNLNSAEPLAIAARYQTGDAAKKAWTDALAAASPYDAPLYAYWSWLYDPALGERMFAIAHDKVAAQSNPISPRPDLWGNYAFYYAHVNPAQARLILERVWGSLLPNKLSTRSTGDLAVAMAAIDGERAWEMASLIPNGQEFESLEARQKIGHHLAMSEEQRPNWKFNGWERYDASPDDEE